MEAAPAWVVIAPPNFAPGISGTATQYDVLTDRSSMEGLSAEPGRPSFTRDIFPILRRIALRQWLDGRALKSFGDLPAQWDTLSQNSAGFREARRKTFALISNCYQDSESGPADDRWLKLTPTQFAILRLMVGRRI